MSIGLFGGKAGVGDNDSSGTADTVLATGASSRSLAAPRTGDLVVLEKPVTVALKDGGGGSLSL